MCKIYENFEQQLQGKYIDETDLLTILAENVEKTTLFRDSTVYIDEFAGFTSQEYEVIKKLIKIAKQVTITICTDELHDVKNPDTDIFYSNQITVNKLLDVAKQCDTKVLTVPPATGAIIWAYELATGAYPSYEKRMEFVKTVEDKLAKMK